MEWAIFTKRRSGGIMAAMRLFWQSRIRKAQTRFLYCTWVQKYYTKYTRPCQKKAHVRHYTATPTLGEYGPLTNKCSALDLVIKSYDILTTTAPGRASTALRRPAKAAVCGLTACSHGRSLLGTVRSEISERPQVILRSQNDLRSFWSWIPLSEHYSYIQSRPRAGALSAIPD